ncbi:MAG: Tad domain-containing protein [Anaerolineales bacterium]
MYTYKSDRGQALVVIALAAVGLIGIVALVVDGGQAFADRRKAQNAADSAALAAALARIRGGQSMTGTALESAAQNGYNNDGTTNIIELYSPPKDGAHAGDLEYIQVIITSHVNTYFARVIGRDKITNTVQAVARTKSAEITELLHGTAVISLAPTSNCGVRKSFWVHGEATLDITGGGIFVNSDNRDCALMTQGNGSIRIRDGFSIDVVGRAYIQKPQLVTPAVTIDVGSISYPPPFSMPKVDCLKSAQISEDGTSMSAGSWGDDFPPEGVTRLEPGVYCLDDGMKIDGDLEGHNVVFKVLGGEVRFGNGTILLDAPSSGDHAGLLLYLPMDNSSNVVLNGGPASTIRGTILAPASHILIKGNSSPRGFHSQIIGYTIEADGNSNVVIVYNDAQNHDSLIMPEVQLSE